MDAILFFVFAAIAVGCAVNLVLQSHPISSALSLVGVMGALGVLYLLLGGEFIAMAQLIVYAGAIMVLFIFVIMLLNAGAEARRGRSLNTAANPGCAPDSSDCSPCMGIVAVLRLFPQIGATEAVVFGGFKTDFGTARTT